VHVCGDVSGYRPKLLSFSFQPNRYLTDHSLEAACHRKEVPGRRRPDTSSGLSAGGGVIFARLAAVSSRLRSRQRLA